MYLCLQWCTKVFFKCPYSAVRHVCQALFLATLNKVFKKSRPLAAKFIQFFVNLIDLKRPGSQTRSGELNANNKFNVRFMSEYFGLLLEFARGGVEQSLVLIRAGAIDKCCKFYLANRHPQASRAKKVSAIGRVGNRKRNSWAKVAEGFQEDRRQEAIQSSKDG